MTSWKLKILLSLALATTLLLVAITVWDKKADTVVSTDEFAELLDVALPYQLQYQLQYRTSGWNIINPMGQAGEQRVPFTIDLAGVLTISYSQNSNKNYLTQYELAVEDLAVDWNGLTHDATVYLEHLQQGFIVGLDQTGGIDDVYHHGAQSEVARNIWLDLLYLTQFRLPKGLEATLVEEDRFGYYDATYQRDDQQGLAVLSKQQFRHDPSEVPGVQNETTIMPKIGVSGASSYQVDLATKTLVSSKVTLQYQQSIGDFDLSMIDYDLNLELVARGRIADSKFQIDQQLASGAWESKSDQRTIRRQRMLSKTVADHDASSLLENLVSLDWSGESPLSNELYLQLKAILELNDEAALEFLALAKDLPHDSRVFQLIVDLLGAVGSEACQQALLALIDARIEDERAIYYAIPSLGLLDQPNLAVEQKLMTELINDERAEVRSTSLLALGNVGLAVRAERRESHEKIFTLLAGKLEEGHSTAEQSLILAALGNLGHAGQAVLVEPFLAQDVAASVKADAIRSLRFHPDSASSRRLLTIAQQESDDELVYQAMYSLRFRKESEAFMRELIAFYSTQNDQRVRQQIVQVLLNHRDFPSVLQTLKNWSEHDPRKEIRDILQMAL